MCHTAINLISKALDKVDNAEVLLKIKGVIALFIQTMDVSMPRYSELPVLTSLQGWGYSVTMLDNFLLTLFEKYAELLKRRFSDDFQEVYCAVSIGLLATDLNQIVSTDDYMPMPISNLDEYDKVVNVSWFTPDKDREELT
jgi:hypothetical protein